MRTLILSAVLVAVASIAPATAGTSHVNPHFAADANARVFPTSHHTNGPVLIRVPRVRTFDLAPSGGGVCDFGDNAGVC